jgi:hypothetical protein
VPLVVAKRIEKPIQEKAQKKSEGGGDIKIDIRMPLPIGEVMNCAVIVQRMNSSTGEIRLPLRGVVIRARPPEADEAHRDQNYDERFHRMHDCKEC